MMMDRVDSMIGYVETTTGPTQKKLSVLQAYHNTTSMLHTACASSIRYTTLLQPRHLLSTQRSLAPHRPYHPIINRTMTTTLASSGGYLTKDKQADEARGPDLVPGLAKTLWGQQHLAPQYPRLQESISTDVCVIGGGLAGLSVACMSAG